MAAGVSHDDAAVSSPAPLAGAAIDSSDEEDDEASSGQRREDHLLERARRRYEDEDPSEPQWALHKKHVFVLSSAGKPVFSRYGDESRLAPQMGLLQAIVSFVHDQQDTIRYVRAGRAQIVFVLRGSLYLVAVSTTGEPAEHIWRQLGFLHAQIISILTSKVEQIFQRNASYDVRNLLGGTDRVMRSLIRSAGAEPAMLLRAVPCLRMPPAARAELSRLLAAARPAECLFALLLAHQHLVTLLRPKRTPLQPADLLLVMNTVASSASFREDEAWLPICLPRFNDAGFLYAHISYVATDLCLVVMSTKADGFAEASQCRQQVAARMAQQGELRDTVLDCLARPQYSIDELGVPEVRHCLYRLPASSGAGLDLCSAPRTGRFAGPQSPYHDRRSVKRLLQHYMLAHSRVHAHLARPLREYVQLTDDETIIVWTASDFELYVAFSPLVSKPVAHAACQKLYRKLKKEQPQLFMLQPALK